MSKKIVIVGALGYIGTELCKIYSGESWHNKVVAIDSRFLSERVNQLNNWNIEFRQGDILDRKFLKSNLNDADVVFHLAGITKVAYVKKESNQQQDENLEKIEDVELLRALEIGLKIKTVSLAGDSFSVDVAEDYKRAKSKMGKDKFFRLYK